MGSTVLFWCASECVGFGKLPWYLVLGSWAVAETYSARVRAW